MIKSKLIGYKKHVVSDFIKDRHPYLESSFKSRYDPNHVFHAVFDRSIPKLVEILNEKNLSDESYQEAFMLLNEMVSHQEKKDIMLNYDLVYISVEYTKHINENVRFESLNLLGSLVSIAKGRENLKELNMDYICDILLNDNLKIREVCGWMLNRLSTGRDGVEILIFRDIVKYIIKSFKKNINENDIKESKFIIYLLECIIQIMQTDEGQICFIGTGFMKKITDILKNILNNMNLYGEYTNRIIILCLHTINSVEMNQYGKEEAIDNKVIEIANNFLKNKNLVIVNNAVRIIMFSTIHLKGKDQAIDIKNDELIINLKDLLCINDLDIIVNSQYTLTNISEKPKGMIIIVKYLSDKINELENIFGVNSIFALYQLLEEILIDPILNEKNLNKLKNYGYCISYFILHKKYSEEACHFTIEKCCKIVHRLAPLIQINDDLDYQNFLANAIYKICKLDIINKDSLISYLDEYGHINCPLYDTTIKKEFLKYDKIINMIYKVEN